VYVKTTSAAAKFKTWGLMSLNPVGKNNSGVWREWCELRAGATQAIQEIESSSGFHCENTHRWVVKVKNNARVPVSVQSVLSWMNGDISL
jgi:hypothetical protein